MVTVYYKAMLYLIITLLSVPITSKELTKDELLRQITKNSKTINIGIMANFTSKISIQNRVINDTGTFYFSPPNRMRAEFTASKMIICSSDDTTWTKMANGDITRSIQKSSMPGSRQDGSTSFIAPDLVNYLKGHDFQIVSGIIQPESMVL